MPEENQNHPQNPEAKIPPTGSAPTPQPVPSTAPQTPAPVQTNQTPQAPTPQPATQIPQRPNPASVYPTPASTQEMVGLSASQMGYNQPKSKFFNFNPKKLFVGGGITLVLAAVVFAILVFTNVVPLFSPLKTISYTNSKNVAYKLKFYSKHETKTLGTGNTQLVSKVSRDGKFPLTLSIGTGVSTSTSSRFKNCGGLQKAMEVQNNNLNQKINVCDALGGKQVSGQDASNSVYLAVVPIDKEVHIITIGQDYSQADLGSSSQAQASLKRFGLSPYKSDIEKIVASIRIEK